MRIQGAWAAWQLGSLELWDPHVGLLCRHYWHLPDRCNACLQDFEALTPNLLARTIETVEGGGIVVLLLSNMSSLTQLYNLSMDVHARLRTESHQEVVGRLQAPLSAQRL